MRSILFTAVFALINLVSFGVCEPATITPSAPQTICAGGSVVLNANTGTGYTYQWYNDTSLIAGATNSSFTVNAIGSYKVIVTGGTNETGGACIETSAPVDVTVSPLPTATITPASATTFCQGGSVVLNANTATGLTYQWKLNGNNITGATSSSYTSNASGSYTVVVTNASTCSSTSTATTVSVNALPTATITPATATTFCQGGSVVLNANTATGLTYQWKLNGNNITGATSSSYTSNASGSYTVVVTNANSCSKLSADIQVTVNLVATILNSAQTICSGAGFSGTPQNGDGNIIPTGTQYSWVVANDSVSGESNSVGMQSSIGQTLVNSTNNNQSVVYTITPQTGTCLGSSFTVTVTVSSHVIPNLTDPMDQSLCNGVSTNAVNFVSPLNIFGTSFSWTNSNTSIGLSQASGTGNINPFTSTNSTNSAISSTIVVTPFYVVSDLTCTGATQTFTILVNPTPLISNKTTTVCSTTAFTQAPPNGGGDIVPSGTTYTWTVASNPNVLNETANNTAQTSIGQTLTNTLNTTETVTYTVTPLSSSCPGSTFTVTVTVSPKPTISDKTSTICSATAFTQAPSNGAGDIVPSVTTYTWTVASNPNVLNETANNTAQTSISQTLTNTLNTAETVTYTVTPLSGSCPGSTFTVTVTVSPKPTISNKTSTICSATAFTQGPSNGAGDIVPSGTTYTWTVASNSNVLNETANNTPQTSISQTLTNTLNTAETVTYTVTPLSGSCPGSTFTVTVTVSPKPTISNKTSTICSATAFTQAPSNGAGDIVPSGTTYTWTVASNPNVLNETANNTAQTSIVQTLTNTLNTAETVTYTVTPLSGSCPGSTFTVAVTVNPKPFIANNSNTTSTACSGSLFNQSPTNGNGEIVPLGTTYTWTIGINPSLSGQAAIVTGQNSIGQTLTNSTNTAQNLTYTVTPVAGLCTGTSFNLIVTIKPKPSITSNLQQTICSEQQFTFTPENNTNGIVPANTTLTWTVSNSNVTGEQSNTNSGVGTLNQTLTNTNYANNQVVYTVTPVANSCTGNSFDYTVTVNKAPNLSVTPTSTICDGNSIQLFAVDAFNTGQLFYSWSNASTLNSSFIFNPIATPQTSTTYTVSATDNTTLCQVLRNVTVNVFQQVANISYTSPTSFCQGGSVTLTANSGVGLSYQWKINGTDIPGATSINYPAISSGVYTVMVTNTNGCVKTSMGQTVIVNSLPIADISNLSATTFCEGESVILSSTNVLGNSYQWKLNGNNISNATSSSYNATASGNYSVIVSNNTSQCSNTSSVLLVTMNLLPNAIITPSSGVLCQGSNTILSANVGSGLSYQWKLNDVAIPGATSLTQTANYSGVYSVVVTNSSQCIRVSQGVIVNPLPIADVSNLSTTTFCQGESVIFNTTNVVGNTYQWKLNGSNIPGATLYSYEASLSGSYSVVVTNTNSCSLQSPSVSVTVHSLPVLSVSADDYNLCVGESTNLNVTGASSYSWTPAGLVSNSNAASPAVYPTSTANFGVTGTDQNGCSNYAEIQITVVPNPTLDLPNTIEACEGSVVSLPGSAAIDWSGITPIAEFTAQQSGYAIATLQNSNLCSAIDSIYLQVNPLPTPDITGSEAVCANAHYSEYSVVSSGNAYSWNVSNGELQGIDNGNTAYIHWYDMEYGPSTFVTMIEHDNITGCEGSDTLFVTFSGLAPNTTNVNLLDPSGSTLYAEDHFAIMNWGATIISNNVDEYTNGHAQYYTFENFDTALRYYWIEAGDDSLCLTRSYYNAPVWQVGVEENQDFSAVNIYPNPTSGVLNISHDSNFELSSVKVYDMTGHLIKENLYFRNQNSFDVSELPSGFYILKLVSSSGQSVNKTFVKE